MNIERSLGLHTMSSFYAVAKGRKCGIVSTWAECESYVKGYKGARFKKFTSERDADEYLRSHVGETTVGHIDKEDLAVCTQDKEILYVYTDGSCRFNGTSKAVCGIGLYIQENDERNISRKLHVPKATNNVAELYAMIAAFELAHGEQRMVIVSDSAYSIHCATEYGAKCAAKGWNVDIPNKELVKTLYEHRLSRPEVTFLHVKAHTGAEDMHSVGNSFADTFALRPLLDDFEIT